MSSLCSIARHRRRLLMQLEKHRRSASSATKRSLPNQTPQSSSKLARFADSPSVSFSKPFSFPDSSTHPPPLFQMPSSSRNFRAPPPRASRSSRSKSAKFPVFDGPLHDERYIVAKYSSPLTPLLAKHSSAPKALVQGLVDGNLVWRTTVHLETSPPVSATADSSDKTKSVMLAALSIALQLNALRMLDNPPKPKAGASGSASSSVVLSDSTTATYEQARTFMDYYCRRFGFGKPDIKFIESRSGIGLGKSNNKKNAQIKCYLDVTAYLESCDPELWKTYLEASVTGSALGMAPKIYFEMSDQLDDEIRDLCVDVKNSQLYRKRPAVAAAPNPTPDIPTGPRSHRPNPALLAAKSTRLSEQRQAYLANPQLAKMRETRASLPVYTRAEEVLSQISANEVTICMAATGSGKTTQIPQLILDSYIERGEGANCNVVCTQPRRLAALSVADRVAKERGETLGKSVASLPEEHGAITFCTTGSSLSGRSLDDVTHVVVDEVMSVTSTPTCYWSIGRREILPLKIILMSATIDPTLFQHYFPDDKGQPAKVIEIPGRSFPVTKHFMDDFMPTLLKGPASWIMREQAVAKYVERETSPVLSNREEDLDLPSELIAATIAHVLQLTDSGHVLVFLPGWEDIIGVQKMLLGPKGPLGINFNAPQYSLHLLHSTIPLAEQQVIFEPPKEGVRRIILSTNIAETSVTIPDVVYVVDTAKIKEQRYDPQRHMSSLVSAWRAGRAGRHRSGEYYGLLGRAHAQALHPNVVMHDVLAACIEPPLPERVTAAMKDLQMVGALDARNDLTSLGRVLLQIPVEVQLGRLVLYGCFFRCLDQALTLAAILLEASRAKLSWTNPNFRSDALAQLSAFNAWWTLQSRGEYITANRFCSDNFLSKPTLLTVQKTKVHLLQALFRAGVIDVSAGGSAMGVSAPGRGQIQVPPALNVNGDSQPLLAALIAIASQPKSMTFIHPSSVNNRKHTMTEHQDEKQLYAFMEKRQNTTTSFHTPDDSNPLTYMLFGAYKLQVTERGLDCDGWLPIVGNLDALDDIQRLKTLMESSMLRVFEGIIMSRRQARASLPPDDEELRDLSLSRDEVKELDFLTRDIVRILNRYSDERMRTQSRQSSRPATPYGRSGFSTPSRPSTPSRGGISRLPF
ncbi:hypothetical protein C8R46DRAFT_1090468 [Mycena filopes]|nr:hypothetical protein C8R46DRAFT_1090468 [Mycena filopes]